MKTKQLANVLIKILGLSVVVHSIPALITALLSTMQLRAASGGYSLYPISTVVLAVLGICLIVKSRCVADLLMKNEEE